MNTIPKLGYGVWQVEDKTAVETVKIAIDAGYRSIDTAAIYNNEIGVGQGIKASGFNRSELYITTKLWNSDQGKNTTLKAFETSLDKLKLDYVDLYLIHWPAPKKDLYVESWKEMIKIKESGRAKNIGVSNFQVSHLERIMKETGVAPYINQIELHPFFQQKNLKEFHAKNNILTEAWSPLGQGQAIANPVIAEIAKRHNKTPAQVILRWHMELGHVAIPKSITPSRIKENFNVFDFKLTAEDMTKMASLDSADGRIGPNPDTADF
jgi:2,5-diketo-D-gluconate reductase A